MLTIRKLATALIMSILLLSGPAFAHCDGLDGPVMPMAQKALDEGDLDLVLMWVHKKDEAEVRRAYEHVMSVRNLGSEAKQLADTFFFETVVRLHRASEGAPYTGLKPAGRDLGPAIPAVDQTIISGSPDAAIELLIETIRKGVRERFNEANSRKKFPPTDVTAGRHYVEAYVPYVHYVERIWKAASNAAHGHYDEPEAHTD